MPVIPISNQVLGGISDTKYLGVENSVYKMIGLNIHGEPGVLKVNQASTKVSGSTVTELVKHVIVCSNGEAYHFSADSGKVWRQKTNGTFELAYTTSAGAGQSKCLGAIEYNGYVLWATENRLHRITITNALVSTWVTLDLNWKTFNIGDLDFHPFVEQNNVLYIGDGYVIAQVDEAMVFSADALDLPFPLQHRISYLAEYLTEVLFGTFVSSTVVQSILGKWNTWSVSFSYRDKLPEAGVNSFLKTDNYSVANVGRKGNFYIFGGNDLEQYKRIPGNWEGTKQAMVYPDANLCINNVPHFGLSNISGNPTEQGIYSIGCYSAGYPKVINLERPISTGNTSNIEIGSIYQMGDDIFWTWKDSTTGTVYGVDKLDTTAKLASAHFDTRMISVDRQDEKAISVEIFHRGIPTGCGIKLFVAKNHSGEINEGTDEVELEPDETGKIMKSANVIMANCGIFRVKLISSGNTAPEVDLTHIFYDEQSQS